MIVKTGIGQDSHRFVPSGSGSFRSLILGGVRFEGNPALEGNSDADVVLHAITNAISGITGTNILGEVADRLCLDQGVTDSRVYLNEALKSLGSLRLTHVSIAIECKTPRVSPRIPEMRQSIAEILKLTYNDVCITATSGEGLTDFGRGLGIQALCVATAVG